MTVYLLDVNVLVALIWPVHESHKRAMDWFERESKEGWATCPLTQAALVRIISNPAFSPDAVSVQEAVNLLATNLRHPRHQFWEDDLDYAQAARPFAQRLVGHQQVTDAYLLALAMHRKGKLATMDRGIFGLSGEKGAGRGAVELI